MTTYPTITKRYPAHLLQHFEEQIAIRPLLQQRQPVMPRSMALQEPPRPSSTNETTSR
jgi:hypothetical protein